METLSTCGEAENSYANFGAAACFKGDEESKRIKKKSEKKRRKKHLLHSAENTESQKGDVHSAKSELLETAVDSTLLEAEMVRNVDKLDDSLHDSPFRKRSGNKDGLRNSRVAVTDPNVTEAEKKSHLKSKDGSINLHQTSVENTVQSSAENPIGSCSDISDPNVQAKDLIHNSGKDTSATDADSSKKRKHKKKKRKLRHKKLSLEASESDKIECPEASTPLGLLSTSDQPLETVMNDIVSGQSKSQICISAPSTVSAPPKNRKHKKKIQSEESENLSQEADKCDAIKHVASSTYDPSSTSAQSLMPTVDENLSGQGNKIADQDSLSTASVSKRKKNKKLNEDVLELPRKSSDCDEMKHLMPSKENHACTSLQPLQPTGNDDLSTLPLNAVSTCSNLHRKKGRKKRSQDLEHKNLTSGVSECDTTEHLKSTEHDVSNKATLPLVCTLDDTVFPKSLGEIHVPEKVNDFAMDSDQEDGKKKITMKHGISSLHCASVLTHSSSDQLGGLVDEQVQRPLGTCPERKLLVLDVNGILVEVCGLYDIRRSVCTKIGQKLVFKRPFCEDFLDFCFARFDVGIWSSLMMRNLEPVVDFLLGKMKRKLLFCWDGSFCTKTGSYTIENKHKPLVLKSLKKIWDQEWNGRWYKPSETLLVDDSPYKALSNPPHTAIFPQPFVLDDEKDNALGEGGTIRVYLEGVEMATDVQEYVKSNPFGQPAISAGHPEWDFYKKVVTQN